MQKKDSRSSSKAKSQPPRRAISKKLPAGGLLPPYGVPIREAMERGNLREMRKVAADARAWQRNVEKALSNMELLIKELEG